jgi:hypothetical protein
MSTERKPLVAKNVEEAVRQCEAIRRDSRAPQDISLSEYVQQKWGISMDAFYQDLKINPTLDTIQNIINLPDNSMRWLIPEIFRDAIRLGLRKAPVYPNLIAGEQTVSQTTVKMPAINMSEATPKKVGVAETITTGSVSFQSKEVSIHKYGRGIKVPYEVLQYVAINLVSIYMQDFGVKMGMGLDGLALTTLLNGDQKDGSDSIATVGVATANTLVFRDLLKIWVRMGRLGKNPAIAVCGEDMATDMMELFVNTRLVGNERVALDIKSPIPNTSSVYIHGSIPAKTAVIVDKSSSLIKLNAQPLLVESEKIISNQTEQSFATITTGFATIYRDSRIALDYSKAFATNGFPVWMDPTSQEVVTMD